MSTNGVQLQFAKGSYQITCAKDLETLRDAGQITAEEYDQALVTFNQSRPTGDDASAVTGKAAGTTPQDPQAPGVNPGAAREAARISALKAQAGSVADLAPKAHDAQDAADEATMDAMQQDASRQGIEAEQKRNHDASHVRGWVTTDETTGKQSTKADVKAAKAKYKEAQKKVETAQQALSEANLSGDQSKIDQAKADLRVAEAEQHSAYLEYTAHNNRYQAGKKRFLGIGSGTARIVRAEKRNSNNYSNVDAVRAAGNLYATEAAAKASGDKDAIYLTDKEHRGLSLMTYRFDAKIAQIDTQIARAANDEERRVLQARKDFYTQFKDLAVPDENGKLDVEGIQRLIEQYTGFDDRLNLEDEVTQLATDAGLSKVQARKFVKKLGFGREHGSAQRWLSALAAFVPTAGLGVLTGGAKATADAVAIAQNVYQGMKYVVDTPAVPGTPEYTTMEPDINGSLQPVTHPAVPGTPEVGHWEQAEPVVSDGETATDHASARAGLAQNLLPAFSAAAMAFIMTRPTTQNAFNEGEIDQILENAASVRGKTAASGRANRGLVQEIIDMDLSMITDDPARQKAIKAAVIQQAIGGLNTGTANTEEIVAARDFLIYAKSHPEVLTGTVEETPPPPTDPDPVDPPKPQLDIEEETTTVQDRVKLPRMKYREGTWYTSHGYVDADGKPLSEAERKLVQQALNDPANKIAGVDTNNDGKFDYRDKEVSLPKEITLPNGKKVKLADNAYDIIMKLPARGGGGAGSYETHYDSTTHTYYVIDTTKPQGQQRVSGGYKTRQEAEAEKTRLENDGN